MDVSRAQPWTGRLLRAGGMAGVLPVFIALLYLACVFGGGLLTVNRDYRAPEQGVTIYLQHNGIHTDLLLPVATEQIDWRREFPAAHFGAPLKPADPPFRLWLAADLPPDRNPAATFVAIGWGDQGFYFDTPRWADLTAATALRAVSGSGPSVLHVEYRPAPQASPHLRKLVLSPAGYAKLVAHIQAAFTRGANAAPIAYPGRGYTIHDTFYAAQGHFSPLRTCNEWVREALADAGVRVPLWAPFPYAMFDSE